jgi:hypothetical protein
MSENYITDIISKYKIIDEGEIRAIYLYYYWIINRMKIFPEMIHSKFNKNKDPRTSVIFKYCYKLQREKKGILEEKDYENYIRAQLIILKFLSKKYNRELVVDINCISGDKAWKRWKIFRHKLRVSKNNSVNSFIVYPNIHIVEKDFLKTKDWLCENIGNINKENIIKNIENIKKWFNLRKISPYFLVLNKHINEHYSNEDIRKFFRIDPLLYKEKINDNIKKLYVNIFKENYV